MQMPRLHAREGRRVMRCIRCGEGVWTASASGPCWTCTGQLALFQMAGFLMGVGAVIGGAVVALAMWLCGGGFP